MKNFAALAILASITAAPVMAETFTRDGVTYSYTTKTVGESTIISGNVVNSGENFRLKVKGGRVVGQMGTRSVSFRTDSVGAVAATGGSSVFAAK